MFLRLKAGENVDLAFERQRLGVEDDSVMEVMQQRPLSGVQRYFCTLHVSECVLSKSITLCVDKQLSLHIFQIQILCK